MYRRIACCGFLLLLVTGTATGQTPDGDTPANEGVCDELIGATPGLYGLCVAFCEAQDCEPDPSLENAFENCRPGSMKILDRYDDYRTQQGLRLPMHRLTTVDNSLEGVNSRVESFKLFNR